MVNHPTPRRLAYDILLRVERDRAYAEPLLDQTLSRPLLQGADRGLLTELVYGVLRRRASLDHLIDLFSSTKAAKLERTVVLLLRLGLYQLFFLDRVPVAAAVNETVNLAKVLAPRAAGLVNAVLRRADRERGAVTYPDREADPAGFLALRYSHPRWIVEQWLAELDPAEAERLAAAMAEPAPLTVRVNTLRISRDELAARWAEAGIGAEPTRYAPCGLRIRSRLAIPRLPGFREGYFTVQDESSQLAALFLDPHPGERVLDACAAPGGKATYLAQLMGNRGELLACDSAGQKLRLIEETATRLGLSIIRTARADAASAPLLASAPPFQRILVDAPCSGIGVLRRNPDGKWWKSAADGTRLATVQRAILDHLAPQLVQDGVLLYATCSTAREENEAVIADFLSRHPDFMLEDLHDLFPDFSDLFTAAGFFRSWPHRDGMDGFFAARLRKR